MLSKAREHVSDDENTGSLSERAVLENSATLQAKSSSSSYESVLALYILGAKVADITNNEDLCYEYFVEVYLYSFRHFLFMRNQFLNLKLKTKL
jgi:hypothetical protein